MTTLTSRQAAVRNPAAQKATLRYLMCSLGDVDFAIPGGVIRQTMNAAAATSDGFPVEEGFVAPLDLRGVLRIPPQSGGSAEPRFAIFVADGSNGAAILVDRIAGLVETHQDDLHPIPAAYDGDERHWFAGILLHDGALVPVLKVQGFLVPFRVAVEVETDDA